MCWQKGATRTNADGAGHVAVVEQIISETEVVTSESGYGCANPFWIQNRKKGDGNWGAGADYKFLGFILNPAVK
jgi:surface antigen